MASNKEEGEATTDLKQHEENGTKSNDKEDSSSIHLKKVSRRNFLNYNKQCIKTEEIHK